MEKKLYQFWIHTEVKVLLIDKQNIFVLTFNQKIVDNIGPLEYILNTPSHHRVHHGQKSFLLNKNSFYIYCLIQIGRNPYCIDKNYAGVLIIWDRIFGTFEAEKKEEKVAYGLVHPSKSLLSKSFDYSNSKFEFSTQS